MRLPGVSVLCLPLTCVAAVTRAECQLPAVGSQAPAPGSGPADREPDLSELPVEALVNLQVTTPADGHPGLEVRIRGSHRARHPAGASRPLAIR